MSTEHLFLNNAISASIPFSNYVKRDKQLGKSKNKINKPNKQNLKNVPRKNFVKPVVKDFLTERKSSGKFVFDFDVGGKIPPSKPLGFERGIDMDACDHLDFLYCHIWDEEGGNMTVNLQHMQV